MPKTPYFSLLDSKFASMQNLVISIDRNNLVVKETFIKNAFTLHFNYLYHS